MNITSIKLSFYVHYNETSTFLGGEGGGGRGGVASNYIVHQNNPAFLQLSKHSQVGEGWGRERKEDMT